MDKNPYNKHTLVGRIRTLYELIPSDEIKVISKAANLAPRNLKAYVQGKRPTSLWEIGRIFEAIKKYFDIAILPDELSRDMLKIEYFCQNLDESEYTDYEVTGPEQMIDVMNNKFIHNASQLRKNFKIALQKYLEMYEYTKIFRKNLYIPLRVHSKNMDLSPTRGKGGDTTVDDALISFAYGPVPFLVLLGDLGTGKTTALKEFHYKITSDFINSRRDCRIPIFLELKEFQKAISIDMLLLFHVSHTLSVNVKGGLESIRRFIEEGRFIFLLDGFDEMMERTDDLTLQRNVMQIASIVHKNNRVILSSRTHHFKSEQHLKIAL